MGSILHVQRTPAAPSRPPMDVTGRGAWAMVQRNRDVYLKTWKTNFLPPLLEPLLYLLSMGYGVGALVREVNGIPYAQFIAPAILAITMMQGAFFETTYNSFVRMYFQKTWDAVTATPTSIDDVLAGEILWSAIKSTINATLMSLVIAAFGLLPWAMIPLVSCVALVAGLVFGGLGLMVSAMVRGIDGFSFAIYLFITPMMLFSGTFFPLAQLPVAAQLIAQMLPLTHTVAAVRALAAGNLAGVPLVSVAYLVGMAALTPLLAMTLMRRKLIV
jgi:lipooligosaccharide transport system permease protein